MTKYIEPKVTIKITIEVDGAEMVDDTFFYSDKDEASSKDWETKMLGLISEANDNYLGIN